MKQQCTNTPCEYTITLLQCDDDTITYTGTCPGLHNTYLYKVLYDNHSMLEYNTPINEIMNSSHNVLIVRYSTSPPPPRPLSHLHPKGEWSK